jgi:hypothetical protein
MERERERQEDADAAAPPLRSSASRASLVSNNSYKKFRSSDYVDPAILTSGKSVLLPLPDVENIPSASNGIANSSKKAKSKGGKGKKRK